MTFGGFPARPHATPVPNVFFSDLLPQLSNMADAAAALCALQVLAASKGFPRYVTEADLAAEPWFARIAGERDAVNAARDGLALAAAIGMLLPLTVERDGRTRTLYFLNAPADRRGLEAVRKGAVDLGRVMPAADAAPSRPGLFVLYETLIGTMSPLVVDELAEAEKLYPPDWIEAAFREAAAQNIRSWRYVSRILERWALEGPDHATTQRDPAGGDARYFEGKYGRILRQRIQRG